MITVIKCRLILIIVITCLITVIAEKNLFSVEPFFITIKAVELKSETGQWVTVIEPDKKVDLTHQESNLTFFNNGRIPPGRYANVRVSLWPDTQFVRKADYEVPLTVHKGSFVNVHFLFDLKGSQGFSENNIRQIHLTVDEDERLDKTENIEIVQK